MSRTRKRGLGRRLLWGIVGYLVTTLGTLLTAYLTTLDVSPVVGSVLATAVGLVVVVIGVFIDSAQEGEPATVQPATVPAYPTYPPGYQPTYPAPYGAPAPARRKKSVVGVIALVLVLCGGGGFAVAYGAQLVGGKIVSFLEDQAMPPWKKKTQDPGTERIAGAATNQAGPLTITVTSVRVNDEVTMVTLTATNDGADTLTLPVFGSAQLSIAGANTLKPDPAASDDTWSESVPPGGQTTGTIVFDGPVGGDVTQVTLSFSQIYGSLSGPRSISVDVALSAG